jgi:hypothetical protein
MTQEFLAGLHSIVEPLLIELGFGQDEVDDDVDEGGRWDSVVFYRAKDCKATQSLESVRQRIEKYYPVAHAGVIATKGPEWRPW